MARLSNLFTRQDHPDKASEGAVDELYRHDRTYPNRWPSQAASKLPKAKIFEDRHETAKWKHLSKRKIANV